MVADIARELGIAVYRNAVPERLTQGALRRLNLEVVANGLNSGDLARWASTTAFPHLRWEPEIMAVRDFVEGYLGLTDVDWRTPQIIYRFPDAATEWPITYHQDTDDDGNLFHGIVAVPLTTAHSRDGGLLVEAGEEPYPIECGPGDIYTMQPHVAHAAGLNTGPHVRCVLYFRY